MTSEEGNSYDVLKIKSLLMRDEDENDDSQRDVLEPLHLNVKVFVCAILLLRSIHVLCVFLSTTPITPNHLSTSNESPKILRFVTFPQCKSL